MAKPLRPTLAGGGQHYSDWQHSQAQAAENYRAAAVAGLIRQRSQHARMAEEMAAPVRAIQSHAAQARIEARLDQMESLSTYEHDDGDGDGE